MNKEKYCNNCNILLTNKNTYEKRKAKCIVCYREICRNYKKANKDKISLYNKQYKMNNKNTISNYNKQYNIKNRKSIQNRHTKYLREKRKNDICYKLSVNSRNRIKKLYKGENKTSNLIGCSRNIFIEWINYQLKPDMNFENYGKIWHMDHVIPCSKFNLLNNFELFKCFNWSNIQPLHSFDNLKKGNRVSLVEIKSHFNKVLHFANNNNLKYYFDTNKLLLPHNKLLFIRNNTEEHD